MTIIKLNKTFCKQAQALKPAQQRRLKETFLIFQNEPQHPNLYNHALTGQWKGYRSISFGGDWRAHYEVINKDTVLFVAVGTHSQLYK